MEGDIDRVHPDKFTDWLKSASPLSRLVRSLHETQTLVLVITVTDIATNSITRS